MSNEDALNNAVNRMQKLVESNPVKQFKGANEAKTRLLIVDEVLNILGWPKNEFEPEQATSTGSYTDYRLTIDGQSRLIVEAKRIGVVNPLPKSIQRPEYVNSFLYTNYESEMTMLLKQCQDYCVQCGVPYALATTGEVWIILIGFKYGVEWGKLKSFVFHSLDDIFQRFGAFYGLVSREAVKNNSLDEKFGSMMLIKPSTAIRPRENVHQTVDVKQPAERQTIQAFFDQFMGDITRPEQESLLKHCYVENYELNEFSRDLQRLLKYDAALDESDLPIHQLDEQKLHKELEYQSNASKPKTILLVGNVGAGKSTFVHKFVKYTKRPDQNICTIVELIDYATKDIIPGRVEEQYLAELVLENLSSEFQRTMDPYNSDVLRGCFEVEIGRFKKQRKILFEQDLQKYLLSEEEHISELIKDKYKHLVGYIKYTRKKRHRAWIVFDNVDRGSNSYQKFIYSFAHRLSVDANCVTIITLRQDTFLEARGAGFLDVRSSDIIFQVTPPEFRRVVSKRRKYVDWLIENNELPKPFKADRELIQLLNWHINRLVLDEDDAVRLLITSSSLSNIRYGLAMLRDYYISCHSTFHELYEKYKIEERFNEKNHLDYKHEYSRFIQSMMLGNSWTYQEDKLDKLDKLYIFNIFSVDPQEKISHFLMLRILAYLSLERNSTSSRISINYQSLCSDFISLGYQRHHVNNAIRKLLYAGLVLSPNLPASPVTEAKVEVPDPFPQDMKVALSARGHYYIQRSTSLTHHPYYQMRAGEDTVWYNEELAQHYIVCLQESITAQTTYAPEDSLQVTDAREIFISYLRRALFEEAQNSYTSSRDWAQKIDDIVEYSVFGDKVTKSNYIIENDGTSDLERFVVDRKRLPTLPQRMTSKTQPGEIHAEQPKIFVDDTEEDYRSADYDGATQDALKSLGQMPKGVKLQKSEYIVRVLWALDIAFQAGLGPLRASDIARIIYDYGKEPVTASSVAHFFQKQRSNGEYAHLWKEEPKRYYTISSSGRNMLASLLTTKK